jgi:hypothetical protein
VVWLGGCFLSNHLLHANATVVAAVVSVTSTSLQCQPGPKPELSWPICAHPPGLESVAKSGAGVWYP